MSQDNRSDIPDRQVFLRGELVAVAQGSFRPVFLDMTKDGMLIVHYKKFGEVAEEPQAFEADGNVAYNPDQAEEQDEQVVAAEPPFIPIMRSGHENQDLQ